MGRKFPATSTNWNTLVAPLFSLDKNLTRAAEQQISNIWQDCEMFEICFPTGLKNSHFYISGLFAMHHFWPNFAAVWTHRLAGNAR